MRLTTGVRSQVLSFLREPLNLVLVLVVPLLVVEGFGQAMSSLPETPTMQAVPADAGRMLGAVFSTAFLAGILGLFQAIDARSADERLVLTGFPPSTLLVTRLVTILLVAGVAAAFSFGVLWYSLTPESPVLTFGFLVAGGVSYALVGVLVGTILPREFEGSLVMVFIANMDAFFGSSMSKVETTLTHYLPLYYPRRLVESAVLDGTYATDDAVGAVVYLAVLFVAATALFSRSMRAEEGML